MVGVRCPATFALEALKAQAVAERTFIYYHMRAAQGGPPGRRCVYGLPLLQCLGVPGAGKKQLG